MLINAQTKIAALIKHHPDALETIVTLSPDFKKLRNPILRKLMAGRTSIAMASKIGGCSPNDFFKKLRPLGFEIDSSPELEEEVSEQKSVPAFIKELEANRIITLDVRSMLAEGNDPLKLIQQEVKSLQSKHVLKIINTFEPTPLIKLLEKQGFEAYADVLEQDLVETYFYRNPPQENTQLEAITDENDDDWEQVLKRFENNLHKIDVRHLEMPMPMMTILDEIEKLPTEKALYVHHKRIPVFLLSELKDRHFDFRIKELADGEVYLLIFKDAS